MKVAMKHPKTGEIKEVKVGWSWTLFFFSGFLGLPLFLRRLHVWGGIFLALWVAYVFIPSIVTNKQELAAMMLSFSLIYIGLQVFMGIKGNEMTAKNYLEHGWTFVEPDSEITKMAKMRWGISV